MNQSNLRRFRRGFFATAMIAASLAGTGLTSGRSAFADDVTINGRTLRVPPGFVIEPVAGPPQVDRPITAAFDEEGRLYVADSSGSNEKVEKQLAEKPHRIVRLEDKDGDGRYETQTVFADKMMFPEGTMWLDGSLYVSAPPSIWKLTDTDGDGVADQRIEWFQGKTLTGCANDLHGPYLGPDGWIYWCKGAFAEQTYERPGKKPLVTHAAHILRCRPDGSGLEVVMTGGMDNPVDVAFTPGGERIFTCTFLQNPGGGNRDGLIHAIYGGIYGKLHSPIYEPGHKWTGPEVMPVLLHMGPAAPCGLTRLESDAMGTDYRDNLFACYFNLHKVGRHVLTPSGASFTTQDEDFVTSPDLDFHPTDVIEDADGSLVVIDTGGWYALCCPSSQLEKPDVLGGVYRIRRKDAPRADDPRGLGLAWKTMTPDALTKLLDDSRPAVRQRAIQSLGRRGAEAAPALAEQLAASHSAQSRINAVWAASRIDSPAAKAVVLKALGDPDETVRQTAIHAISVNRDANATASLVGLLRGPSLQNRRAAAEALGRIGDRAAVPELLEAISANETNDRILEHSLIYALIEIADPESTRQGFESANTRVKRAAMIAVDQMDVDGGGNDPNAVAALLTSPDQPLKEAASWIIGRHPEWAEALAGVLRSRLTEGDLNAADLTELERQLAKFAATPEIQALLAERLADAGSPRSVKLACLHAMEQANLKSPPKTWLEPLTRALGDSDPEVVAQAVATAKALRPAPQDAPALLTALKAIGRQAQATASLRLAALSAVSEGLVAPAPEVFTFLATQLGKDQPAGNRSAAAEILARAKLSPAQLEALTATVREAGPIEVDRLLTAFEQTDDETIGLKLVQALLDSSALSSLRIDLVKQHLAQFGPKVADAAEALYRKLNANIAGQKARIDELMGKIAQGDIRRGQAVFHSEKAACYTCHAIGYRGGNVGPDLTKVGGVRAERDLLEAIVFPSASLIRSYEPVVVATADGKVYNGLLRNETSDEIRLVTGANQEARIARDDIEEIRPSTVSVMPAGLDQQLTAQELADLVAFLKACR